MSLTPREAQLAVILLRKASDLFSNRSCSDFNLVTEAGMSSQKERKALNIAVDECGGDEEGVKATKADNGSHEWADDWCLMSYIAGRLEDEYGDCDGT